MSAKYSPLAGQVYDYLQRYIAQHTWPPTYAEIARHAGVSRGAVVRCMDQLEAWGCIERLPGRARAIRLVRPPADGSDGAG